VVKLLQWKRQKKKCVASMAKTGTNWMKVKVNLQVLEWPTV